MLFLLVTVLLAAWVAGVYYNSFGTLLVITAVAAALAIIYFIPAFAFDKNLYNQNQFRGFARFLLRRPLSDWAIAIVVSICGGFAILATSRLVSPKGAWNLEAPEAMGTMISLFVGILAVSVLYRRHAPIEELDDLIKLISDDLSTVLHEGGSVWVSFPAISIGCHSSTDDHGNIDLESPFWTMKKRLDDCLESRKVNVCFIVYDNQLAERLFAEYHDRVGGGAQRLDKWKEIEREMRATVPRANNCLIYADPMVLTNFVIVVGNCTYLIQAHGFPHYVRNEKDSFAMQRWRGHFIKSFRGLGLIAYRREDSGLALRTLEQLKLWRDFLSSRRDLAAFEEAEACQDPKTSEKGNYTEDLRWRRKLRKPLRLLLSWFRY
jgi:hypothetical protein